MRTFTTKLLPFCFLVLLGLSANAAEPYWNQFRGPHADGTTRAKGLPVKFSEGSKQIAWKTAVKGRAWSSPVIWGDQVWITNAPEIQNPPNATNRNALPGFDEPLEKPIELSAVCLDLKTGDIV
ncbi:MAG: hypothetical protein CMJ78_04495, partial [Planctomycetaceae bacterium]|nr:hypothetical protein [Planctomycetaceae bacterium]